MAAFPGVGNGAFVRTKSRPPWRLPILDGYILREMAPPFAFAFGVYLLFWFFNIFFVAADYVVNKGAPGLVVLRFLVYRVPQGTPQAFPFACLFATLMAFGRLMADNEINAMRTSGVSFKRIIRLPLILGLGMFGVSWWINENVVPKSTDLSTRTFYQIMYKTQSLPIEPNIFRQDPSTGNTFNVGSIEPDNRTMHNVMIFHNAPGTARLDELISAQSATLQDAQLVLIHPTITHFKSDGSVDGVVVSPSEMSIALPLAETAQNFLSSTFNDPFTMDSKQLATDIKVRKATGMGGSDLAKREITLAEKLALPFASFIAVIVALPLAVRFGKKGRALGIALSLVTMFVYYALEAMAGAFGRNNLIDPYLAAWIPNALMAMIGAFLIFSEDR